MIAVMVSKWVADSISPDGIYIAWIKMHDYPFLPNSEFRDRGETAEDLMTPIRELAVIDGRKTTLAELGLYVPGSRFKSKFTIIFEAQCMNRTDQGGFPVTDQGYPLGYVTRDNLLKEIGARDA